MSDFFGELEKFFFSSFPLKSLEIVKLAGDGSSREYLRAKGIDRNHGDEKSFVAMRLFGDDHLALKNSSYPWLRVHAYLHEQKSLLLPRIYGIEPTLGVIAMEDLGDQDLTLALESEADVYFSRSLSILSLLKGLDIKNFPFPEKTLGALFLKELHIFFDFCLQRYFSLPLSGDDKDQIFKEFAILAKTAGESKEVICHRDFHARNIMLKDDSLYLIDFQDAQRGPLGYDLVSIVFDAYQKRTLKDRLSLLELGIETLGSNPSGRKELSAALPHILLQRQLKAIGSFAKLTLEKERSYMPYLPAALPALFHFKDVYQKDYPLIVGSILPFLNEKGKTC